MDINTNMNMEVRQADREKERNRETEKPQGKFYTLNHLEGQYNHFFQYLGIITDRAQGDC